MKSNWHTIHTHIVGVEFKAQLGNFNALLNVYTI